MNSLNENLFVRENLGVLNSKNKKVKVLQFGEGNFLRGFVTYMIDELNSNGLFNGSIKVVQPIENGLIEILNEQDGLYTLLLRGIEDGKEVCTKKIVSSIKEGVNPYSDFDDYISEAKNPDLRFVFSNTTESGIVYNDNDKLEDKPQTSFPAKITAFLYERFKSFSGDPTKGLVFIPCELIDNNGDMLKEIVHKYADKWNLTADFKTWLTDSNIFTNTLVDRIVTGYPRNEIEKLTNEFGYSDKLINTGEIFHFWVIEGPAYLSEELPFDKIGLNVVWTDNATPYKMRKVRILNGGHTCSVLAAFLGGKNTVGEMISDPIYNKYLKMALFEEIIPTLDLPIDDLNSFANSVFDRFANPYIEHFLLSISLNSVSKFKARVIPSITEFYKRKHVKPTILTFSLAALIDFYKGDEIKGNVLIGTRNGEIYEVKDDLYVLEYFKNLWYGCDYSKKSFDKIANEVCKNEDFWGTDLTQIEGLQEDVSKYLYDFKNIGLENTLKKLLEV